ncbi:MAG: ATPase [Coxiella sp. RIFCSPHIGHO2_12_FULL_44_14]|nr:MAG: ATPase [Coxiella sp. RIFCSPHIGHO2_12_FULL_44_14]
MNICTHCVMPHTAESLLFDEQGKCSVCKQIEFKRIQIDWEKRRQELDQLTEVYRGKNDYDCIVPFSGGKDSTFTLWYIVRQLRLKPLVVRFDHGFFRPNVQENADRTFRRLGCDVLHFIPNWQIVRKLMYEALVRRGDFCWHCHTGIFSYPLWIALKFSVPLVFWGEPDGEYSSFYTYEDVQEADEARFNRFINLGINAEDMLGMLDNTLSDYPVLERDLKPYTYPSVRLLREAHIRSVFLGSYIPWDVRHQVKIIQSELGWREDQVEGTPPNYGYEKIECYVQGVRDYIKYLKRGFGRTTHLVSIDIRNQRLLREEGMRLAKEYDGKRPAALDRFLRILGLSEEQFMEIIARHVVAPHTLPKLSDIPSVSVEPNDFAEWDRRIASWEVKDILV